MAAGSVHKNLGWFWRSSVFVQVVSILPVDKANDTKLIWDLDQYQFVTF